MTHKLTDAELAEHHVILIIPVAKWRGLPEEVKKELLDVYIDHGTDKSFIFSIPAYLARQLEEMAMAK